MSLWKKIRLGDACTTNVSTYSPKEKWSFVNYLDTGNIVDNKIDSIQYIDTEKEKLPSRARRKVRKNSIIYSTVRPNQRHFGIIKEQPNNFLVSTGFTVIDVNTSILDADFLYYRLSQNDLVETLHSIAEQSTSAYPSIKASDLEDLEIAVPDIDTQVSIGRFLSNLEEKIKCNEEINDNLEAQLSSLFIHNFSDDVASADIGACPMLGDLITVIDNRGKTPPLTTETIDYPIIDVGALKGSGRIVDFNNCTKYVTKTTYDSWFRSGHPQPWDILISTVGSLAEMKIYLGSKGCIAQNVVALRAKSISPLYLYQYLRFIRADLVAYNIGSVQPSIKVTHIIKHPIFVPETSKLKEFEEVARVITNRLYTNYNECESLKKLRDTLLPKLMSGELDVSNLNL